VCLLLQALAFLGFTISTGLELLYLAATLFGFAYGGVTSLFPALIGDFFGRAAVGAIVGFIFALAGYIYNATNSYSAAFELSAALNVAAFLLIFFLKKPQRAAF
jgi:MFS family permease